MVSVEIIIEEVITMLEIINTIRRDGNELFLDKTNNFKAKLEDFWMWAHSDLLGNAERGILAEYIVALALGVNLGTRTEWDSYDIITDGGIKVEVKSSGYIQTWFQKTYSEIKFGIQPTQAWDKGSNTYESSKKRQADVYVFCIHMHKEQETINPLDLQQWEFYVLNSNVLNKKVSLQKSILLNPLKKLGAVPCNFECLKEVVNNEYNRGISNNLVSEEYKI